MEARQADCTKSSITQSNCASAGTLICGEAKKRPTKGASQSSQAKLQCYHPLFSSDTESTKAEPDLQQSD